MFPPRSPGCPCCTSRIQVVPLIDTISTVKARGQVEKWLLELETDMIASLRKVRGPLRTVCHGQETIHCSVFQFVKDHSSCKFIFILSTCTIAVPLASCSGMYKGLEKRHFRHVLSIKMSPISWLSMSFSFFSLSYSGDCWCNPSLYQETSYRMGSWMVRPVSTLCFSAVLDKVHPWCPENWAKGTVY